MMLSNYALQQMWIDCSLCCGSTGKLALLWKLLKCEGDDGFKWMAGFGLRLYVRLWRMIQITCQIRHLRSLCNE